MTRKKEYVKTMLDSTNSNQPHYKRELNVTSSNILLAGFAMLAFGYRMEPEGNSSGDLMADLNVRLDTLGYSGVMEEFGSLPEFIQWAADMNGKMSWSKAVGEVVAMIVEAIGGIENFDHTREHNAREFKRLSRDKDTITGDRFGACGEEAEDNSIKGLRDRLDNLFKAVKTAKEKGLN